LQIGRRPREGVVCKRFASGAGLIEIPHRIVKAAHYEVEHFNPNHGHLTGNLVEVVHDPLGLELLLTGTIRDETVRFDDQRQQPVGSMLALCGVNSQPFIFGGLTADRNTLRIGIVVITAATH
jgi:hypothetical protein